MGWNAAMVNSNKSQKPDDIDQVSANPDGEQKTLSDNLLLPNLKIHGFRGFKDLELASLGRVNLIVGKNSVGKSTLLDAIRLIVDPNPSYYLIKILERRDEFRGSSGIVDAKFNEHVKRIEYNIENIFYGVPPYGIAWDEIEIRSGQLYAYINFYWENVSIVPDDVKRLYFVDNQEVKNHIPTEGDSFGVLESRQSNESKWKISLGRNYRGTRKSTYHKLESNSTDSPNHLDWKNIVHIDSSGQSDKGFLNLWEKIALSEIEDHVIDTLKIIDPRIVRVSTIAGRDGQNRIVIARIAGQKSPVTLRSLGDGAVRLFGIALGIANAENGVALLDEIENGLHWSVHAKMWEIIFSLAEKLNVQVFATTHSYDCVKGFATAAHNHPSDAALIRLERKNGDVIAKVIDEESLEYAIQEDIEVR
jgi:energy-coupling factor transporter ATP-binding protein EcfA2